MAKYFSSLVKQSLARSAEATLSILKITNPQLREHLMSLMNAGCGESGSFLSQPVFEHTFGWEKADKTMKQLTSGDGLLSPELVKALDNKENDRYRFVASWQPYKHQLKSWHSLLKDKHSIVVTSGTGSGKTECFMVPVLEDLFREYQQQNRSPLVGVRALFLYPLNALINSQRERLDAWTRSFDKGIRYCLYNGNTEEKRTNVRSKQQQQPNEILSRELLREEPAPILITNGTMLEYMMIRQADSPILRISKERRSLRWIILDEAHSYVGSQAAELALQLRRAMHAFGVTPADIRFRATSATIGGEEAEEQLKCFLSDLSGVPAEQIDVIGGNRVIPEIEKSTNQPVSLEGLEAMQAENQEDSQVSPNRFSALVHSPEARSIRNALVNSKKPLQLVDICKTVNAETGGNISQPEMLRWLDVASGTQAKSSEPAFLKLRAHLFQRITHGLWACFDPECSAKKDTPLSFNWSFGSVYVSQRSSCECGSPVFELAFCNDCNQPHLLARDRKGKLVQWDSFPEDEFSLLVEDASEESPANNDTESKVKTTPVILSTLPNEENGFICFVFDKLSATFDKAEVLVSLGLNDQYPNCSCSRCGNKTPGRSLPFRRALLGSPFYVANAVPTVLEYCPDFDNKEVEQLHGAQSLPGRGKRLITFTDSRQGTAKMAIKMQQEAECNKLRGLVVDILKRHQINHNADYSKTSANAEQLKQLLDRAKGDIDTYRQLGMPIEAKTAEDQVASLEAKLAIAEDGSAAVSLTSLTWEKMVDELQKNSDLQESMLPYNQYHKPDIFDENSGPRKLSELLLLREFMRRPTNQNSLETQGLIRVGYQGLETISKPPPDFWENKKLSVDDWKNFLKISLDFFVRANSFIDLDKKLKSWIGSWVSPKSLRNPESKESEDCSIQKWPQIEPNKSSHRLIKLLLLAAKLNPKQPADIDIVNYWLKEAWKQLTCSGGILQSDENKFFLKKEKLTFSLLDKAYQCPVTNKLLDVSFCGFTPYLPTHINFDTVNDAFIQQYKVGKLFQLPPVWEFDRSQEDYSPGINKIRELVASNK
ncbi:MAG: DEAD/DEAH box helicase, partial [Endozoicomonadaceae bacterium]|nr:DEAD/DEAH box helicase [Endozoicomonadaceae bacterium]